MTPDSHSTGQSPSREFVVRRLLHTRVFNHAYGRLIGKLMLVKSQNDYLSVAPTCRSLRGRKSLGHTHTHTHTQPSHRPATCPQPAEVRKESQFVFHPDLLFISFLDSKVIFLANSRGQLFQSPVEMVFQRQCRKPPKDNRK